MAGRRLVLRSSSQLSMSTKTYADKKQRGIGECLRFLIVCIMRILILICGCSCIDRGLPPRSTVQEANAFFNEGKYEASLSKYEEIIAKHPAVADRVLFEMGILYAHPRNEQKDYQKSLECFQKLIKEYPESEYRQNSEMMIFNIQNVVLKDQTITAKQMQIETLRDEVQGKENEIVTLHKKIEA